MGIENKIQETVGKAKEGLGDLVGNDELSREGQKDRMAASARQVGEDVGSKLSDATVSVADKAEDLKRKVTDQR